MNLFHITPSKTSIEHDFWRVFGKEDCSDVNLLPRKTSLQRMCVEFIENGNIPMVGDGIIFMKDREIIKE